MRKSTPLHSHVLRWIWSYCQLVSLALDRARLAFPFFIVFKATVQSSWLDSSFIFINHMCICVYIYMHIAICILFVTTCILFWDKKKDNMWKDLSFHHFLHSYSFSHVQIIILSVNLVEGIWSLTWSCNFNLWPSSLPAWRHDLIPMINPADPLWHMIYTTLLLCFFNFCSVSDAISLKNESTFLKVCHTTAEKSVNLNHWLHAHLFLMISTLKPRLLNWSKKANCKVDIWSHTAVSLCSSAWEINLWKHKQTTRGVSLL